MKNMKDINNHIVQSSMSIFKKEDTCSEHLPNLSRTSIKSTWNVSKICPKVPEIYWGRFVYDYQVPNSPMKSPTYWGCS